MIFSWLKNRRRRKILAEPFPPEWEAILQDLVRHDAVLPDADRVRLRQAVQVIIAEKDWTGADGQSITDEVRVVCAALAGILVLGMPPYLFDDVTEIIVTPTTIVREEKKYLGYDVQLHEEQEILGEATISGVVRLAWDEVRTDALQPGSGHNLVFHEFAHQLDNLNGAVDGTPNLPTQQLADRWAAIMDHEYRRLQRAERRGRTTLLDPYGATEPWEFFAVATECFFDAPQAMRDEYPELYALFRDYYRQDPATWRPFDEVAL